MINTFGLLLYPKMKLYKIDKFGVVTSAWILRPFPNVTLYNKFKHFSRLFSEFSDYEYITYWS